MSSKTQDLSTVADADSSDDDFNPAHGLTWWCRHAPYEISNHIDVLRDVLIERTRGLVDDELLNRILLRGDRLDSAFLIACRLYEIEAELDLVFSWLTFGGLSGDPFACKLVYDAILDKALKRTNDETTDFGTDLFALMIDWRTQIPGRWRSGLRTILGASGRELLLRRVDLVEEEVKRPTPKSLEVESGKVLECVGVPLLIPVREIGDASSRDGKEAVARYGVLTKPLVLAGGEIDPEVLATALLMEFPWMESAIAAVCDDLRLLRMAGQPWLRFRPILLVGPPGVGKTRFAQQLGALASTGCEVVSAAGTADNRMLAGTARGWSSGQPALPLLTMMRTKTANPILVIDEVDKSGGGGQNGDLRATLLTMLEPQTAGSWPDEYLLAPSDLRQISWILTANDLSGIPEPLLSRVRIIRVGGPLPDHFDALFHGILRHIAEDLMVPLGMLPYLEPKAVDLLRKSFERKASVRSLKGAITAALSCSAATERRLLH